jgi:predicted ATP-grasp superfamily ATP-dependent carboligase
MIQEIVPGDDDAIYGYLGFWDEQALERVWLTFRKLRQYPPSYGDGSLMETTEAQQVAEYSRRLLRGFHYRGFVEVEFKLDARDHTLRLLEINPRSTSFNELAVGSGLDFPWIGYELAGREQACVNVGRSRLGVRYVDEELDFQAFRSLTQSGKLSFAAWVRSIFRARPIIFAWDDPMPIVNGLWRLLRNLVQGNRIV